MLWMHPYPVWMKFLQGIEASVEEHNEQDADNEY